MSKENVSVSKALPIAFQHVVAMVVSCITVPVILSTAANLPDESRLIMMQASLLCAALAIFIHALRIPNFGSCMPVMVASGFAFVPTLTNIATTGGGMSYVLGAQLVGSVVGILFGLIFKHIRFLFPRVVTAAVILTIGISLYSTAVRYMAGGITNSWFGSPKSWITALVTLSIVTLANAYGKGMIKLSSTLLGLVGGYLFSWAIGIVHMEPFYEAGYLAIPQPLYFGLNFSVGAIVPMIIIFIINDLQDIGQFEATAHGVYGRQATDTEIRGGLIANCATSIFGSFVGGVPNATCGQNVGIVITTGVKDRIVFLLAAGIVAVTAFVPKIAGLFLTIPYPVLGGATVTVFGSIAMTGIRMLANEGFTQRNTTIVGLSVAIAVGFAFNTNAFRLCPEWVQLIFGRSEVVIVALLAVILNLILPKDKPQGVVQVGQADPPEKKGALPLEKSEEKK